MRRASLRRASLDQRIAEIFGRTPSVEDVVEDEGLTSERRSERRRCSHDTGIIDEDEGLISSEKKHTSLIGAKRCSLDAAIDEVMDEDVLDEERRDVHRKRNSLDEHIAEVFESYLDCDEQKILRRERSHHGAWRTQHDQTQAVVGRRSLFGENDPVKEAWRSRGRDLVHPGTAVPGGASDEPMSLDQMMAAELWEAPPNTEAALRWRRCRQVLAICWWRGQAEARRLAMIEDWRNGLPSQERQRVEKLYELGALRATDPLARQMRYVRAAQASAPPVSIRAETIPTQCKTSRLTSTKARPPRNERRLNSIETAALLALHEQSLLAKGSCSVPERQPNSANSTRKGALTPATRR